MSIDIGLRTLLLAQSSITSLVPAQVVGGVTFNGIFNEEPTEGFVPPFIVISEETNDPMLCLDGTYGMQSTEVSIDCYATNLVDARAISAAVGTFLNDYSGAAGASDTINAVLNQGRTYRNLHNQDGTDSRQRISSISYQIQHTAS